MIAKQIPKESRAPTDCHPSFCPEELWENRRNPL